MRVLSVSNNSFELDARQIPRFGLHSLFLRCGIYSACLLIFHFTYQCTVAEKGKNINVELYY